MTAGGAPLVQVAIRRALRPPLRDPRYWVIQILIILVAVGHESADRFGLLQRTGIPEFAPVALFVVPVLYAALDFGLAGSVATAAWLSLLTIPDIIFGRSGVAAWADAVQLTIICVVAVFVGYRMELEVLARERAEAASRARAASEASYRALFEGSPVPILVFEPGGAVKEANPAARALLGLSRPEAASGALDQVRQAALAAPDAGDRELSLRTPRGTEMLLHALRTGVQGSEGERLVQVVLQDVTDARRRQSRLDAYATHMLRGQEEERRRIAQEIHDEPIQTLTHLCHRLDVLPGRAELPPPTSAALDGIREVAESVAQNLRRLAHGLRPPSLDDLGMVASLRRLVADFEAETGVSALLRVDGGDRRLEPEMELGLFRIAQEALTNVERHAGARHVVVDILFDDSEVRLRVCDDGDGLPAAAEQRPSGGLGVLGMRERATLLGGRFTIQGSAAAGTEVEVKVPTAVAIGR